MFPSILPGPAVAQWQRELAREKANTRRALARGLNRTLVSARKVAKENLRSVLNIKASAFTKRVTLRKGNLNDLTVSMRVSARPVPLTEYTGTRVSKRRGVSVKPDKRKPRLALPLAFRATMGSGRTAVYIRTMDSKSSIGRAKGGIRKTKAGLGITRRGRLPIKEVLGPNVADKFFAQVPRMEARLEPIRNKHLTDALAYFRQSGGKRG